MTIFNVFSLFGGLALFLFGMDIMGKALEKQAGGQLQKILSKLPMITPMAWCSSMMPLLTKPTTITVVALED